MDGFAIGLPNQALKPLVSTFVSKVVQTKPYENDLTALALVAGTETFLLGTSAAVGATLPLNFKTFISSLKVLVTVIDTVFKLYRNGVLIGTFEPGIINQSVEVFANFVGAKEFDENDLISLSATSVTGGGNATAVLSGESILKRNELFSQVIA